MDFHRIFELQSPADFEAVALETFHDQYQNVAVYREFCEYLGLIPSDVNHLKEIPFLPIELFKDHTVLRSGMQPQKVFRSSGTTAGTQSGHFVADLGLYRESFRRCFQHFYGLPTGYCILAMLPSYQDRPDASLIYMVSDLIEQSHHPLSGFVSNGPRELYHTLDQLEARGDRVLLLGVSFALLDLAQHYPRGLKNVIVMETGGMKGRRREMIRAELHQILGDGFGMPHIHSEYGMTELLSQAYSTGGGLFQCPAWMKILVRDTEDPFTYLQHGRTGGINIIDLANQHSCAFLSTQDLGKTHRDGQFEVLGRFDHSDIRGCNLMAL